MITTLTNSLLQKRLQIANACAASMASDMIVKQNKGISCRKEQKTIQLMLDIIDGIKENINLIEGEYIWCLDGVDLDVEFDDTDSCLKINELLSILDRLCQMCKKPCETVLNFS